MRRHLVTICILGLLITVWFFQACGIGAHFLSSSASRGSSRVETSGNGDGYEGKPDIFEYRESEDLCSDIGVNLKALPNRQIFSYKSGLAQLVRDNCADITPQNLSAADYSVNPQGELTYQNQVFAANTTLADFDVVAASCPVGRTPIVSPARSNMLLDSLDLRATPWGGLNILGITQRLDGTLAGLPLYAIERDDPNALENYRRPAQSPTQVVGVPYVFSFFAKTNATEKALFISDLAGVQDLEIEFDLVSGAANTLISMGVSNVSTTVRTFSGGLFISVYFTPTATANAHIGVASAGSFLGSTVSLTAFQLERVADFCSP